MLAFSRLIRLPNLLIVALTQYLIRYGVLLPFMELSGLKNRFSDLDFALLVLSTVLIAAAGYVINDYFDTRTDRINRPERVVIDKGIKRRVAMALHVVLNILGIGLGFYLGYKVGIYKLGLIHAFSAGLLWFYSTDFKKQFLIGNIIVSLLTTSVPMIVPVFELPLVKTELREVNAQADEMQAKFMHIVESTGQVITEEQAKEIEYYRDQSAQYRAYVEQANGNLNYCFNIIGLFAIFAFLASLIREIIKDMEDYEGDSATGCRTMPIVLGISTVKYIVVFITLAVMAGLAYVQYLRFKEDDMLSVLYLTIGAQLPLILLIFQLLNAKERVQFGRASMLVKIIMLVGVCYSLVIWYSLNQ
jgi:4-hydroxybenzoate polyprenyltransferase